MILENSRDVSTNLTGSTEFTVSDDSAKIFSFLSNFLYKDKERSVMTELCSNALDAHKEAGKESTPILVHLPTDLQKEFRVRDFGPGLSQTQIIQFLTKYGSSSKNQRADLVGGFGIGSKSPAAVTDTWTVNSHHNGEFSSYIIFINDRGIPNINKLFTKETTETGLEVIVPTKNSSAWHNAAQAVFEHYEVMPDIRGTSRHFTQVKFGHSYHGLANFHDRTSSSASTGSINVLMNRRSYELDSSKISIVNPFVVETYIPFEISSLSVSLSREDLQYDAKTIAAIETKLKTIHSKLKDEWKSMVSVKTDIYEYKLAASEFKKEKLVTPHMCVIMAADLGDTHAKDVDFSDLSSYSITLDKTEKFNLQYVGPHCARAIRLDKGIVGSAAIAIDKTSWNDITKVLSFRSSSKGDLTFVLRDVKDAPSRLMNAVTNRKVVQCIIMDKEWFDMIPSSFTKVKASDFEKAPRVQREAKEKIESEIYQLSGKTFSRIKETSLDQTKDVVYGYMTNANTSSSIVNPFDRKFVEAFPHVPHGQLIFIKPGTVPPDYAITCEQWTNKTYDALWAKKDNLSDIKKFQALKTTSLYYLLGKICNHKEFLTLPTTTVAGGIRDTFDRLKNGNSDLTFTVEFDRLNKCAELLSKPLLQLQNYYDFRKHLIEAYPLTKLFFDKMIEDSDIPMIVGYMKDCGK